MDFELAGEGYLGGEFMADTMVKIKKSGLQNNKYLYIYGDYTRKRYLGNGPGDGQSVLFVGFGFFSCIVMDLRIFKTFLKFLALKSNRNVRLSKKGH